MKVRKWGKLFVSLPCCTSEEVVKLSYVTWSELIDLFDLVINFAGVFIAILAYLKNSKK